MYTLYMTVSCPVFAKFLHLFNRIINFCMVITCIQQYSYIVRFKTHQIACI